MKLLRNTIAFAIHSGGPPLVLRWVAHVELPNGHVVSMCCGQLSTEPFMGLPQRCAACKGTMRVARAWCEECTPDGRSISYDPTDHKIAMPGHVPGVPMLDHPHHDATVALAAARTPEDVHAAVTLAAEANAAQAADLHRAGHHHSRIFVQLGSLAHATIRHHLGLDPQHPACSCEHCHNPTETA